LIFEKFVAGVDRQDAGAFAAIRIIYKVQERRNIERQCLPAACARRHDARFVAPTRESSKDLGGSIDLEPGKSTWRAASALQYAAERVTHGLRERGPSESLLNLNSVKYTCGKTARPDEKPEVRNKASRAFPRSTLELLSKIGKEPDTFCHPGSECGRRRSRQLE
jgi:hypothetical protein